jgi:RAB protein geranylgeranyltransferase component A
MEARASSDGSCGYTSVCGGTHVIGRRLMEIKKKKSGHFLNEELRIKKMRKLKVVVVEPKKQSKWPAFLQQEQE